MWQNQQIGHMNREIVERDEAGPNRTKTMKRALSTSSDGSSFTIQNSSTDEESIPLGTPSDAFFGM